MQMAQLGRGTSPRTRFRDQGVLRVWGRPSQVLGPSERIAESVSTENTGKEGRETAQHIRAWDVYTGGPGSVPGTSHATTVLCSSLSISLFLPFSGTGTMVSGTSRAAWAGMEGKGQGIWQVQCIFRTGSKCEGWGGEQADS